LAFIGNGGHVVACSDARYGKRPNILMSGVGNGPYVSRITVYGFILFPHVFISLSPIDLMDGSLKDLA
jgi:hypothetical protein